MGTTCPVTCAYLRAVQNIYDFTQVQYELYAEPFAELVERAENDSSARVRQHQRAFYCIELMVFRCWLKVEEGNYWKTSTSELVKWPRSREGLDTLLTLADVERDEMLAEMTEYFYQPILARETGQMEHHQHQRRAECFKLICESCVILRQALKNPEIQLARVGKRLAKVADIQQVYIGALLDWGQELLDHTEGTMRRAWEPQKT